MFALIDAHNFYVSCERVFQPHLKHKAVAVLSNNDGCVVARSNEVKALGCPMGAPYFKVKSLFHQHDVQVFSSNYRLYGDMSARLMSVLMEMNAHCEVYSIDEAFLYFDTMQDFHALGQAIRKRVWKWLGLPVGVGFGKSKALAKAANRLSKAYPQHFKGCCVLDDKNSDHYLKQLPIDDLWGIGWRHAKVLKAKGLKTAYDFKQASPESIKKQVKTPGLQLQAELWGRSCLPLIYEDADKKSICSSKSFGKPLIEKAAIAAALLKNIQHAYRKCLKQHLRASHMMIFIHSSRYAPRPIFRRAITALDAAPFTLLSLGDQALTLLSSCFQDRFIYHKSGVLLWGLQSASHYQASLFEADPVGTYHSKDLDRALQCLHKRYGQQSILRASQQQYASDTALKSQRCSPCFTSRWEDLPRVSG